jgi:hypothetical protein
MADGSRSSTSESPVPTWVRLLIPSMGDLIFASLLALLVFTPLSIRLLGDAGIGWHIRAGQQILMVHAIPRVDSFSSTMKGHPWFAWEWAYDVVVGWLERGTGLNGVVSFTALIIALVFAGIFRWLVRRGTNVFLALALVLLAVSASMIHFLARPHVVSWLFTLFWLWILESSDGRCGGQRLENGRLWLLPLVMLVWVNVHGGFLIGFVLLGIYAIGTAWQWFAIGDNKLEDFLQKLRAGKRARNLVVVAMVAALVTLANPYGWKLHIHIFQYLTNRFLMDHIDEFQSPNFHGVAQRCFAVLLLVTFVSLAAKRRGLLLREALIVLFAVYSGLYASRNIPVSSLLLLMVIGPISSQAFDSLASRRGLRFGIGTMLARIGAFSGRMGKIEASLRGHVWAAAAVVLVCFIVANGGRLGSGRLMDAHFDDKRFPVEGISYLDKHEPGIPVLTPDYWGGYVIYRLYPKTLVAMDDRHDLYGDEFLKSYLKMVHVEPGWEGFLREHDIQCVLMRRGSALANILAETKEWKAIYADNVAIAFARVSGRF